MSSPNPQHIVVVGAGAAGLMAARELARAGNRWLLHHLRRRGFFIGFLFIPFPRFTARLQLCQLKV
jgi:thioredoxin reductase